MNAISWRFWAAAAVLVTAWLILGFTLPGSVSANDIYDVAAVAAFFACVAFTGVYTIAGLRGPAKWWRNDLATYLVLAVASLAGVVGVPAFAVLFNGGLINTRWWAWAWIGTTAAAALMIGGLTWIYLRTILRSKT